MYWNQSRVITREQLPVMDVMEQSTGKLPDYRFVKSVLLLKNRDYERKGGQVLMPTESEIKTMQRRLHLGQYKKEVQFHSSLSEDMVKKELEEIFPYLKNRR